MKKFILFLLFASSACFGMNYDKQFKLNEMLAEISQQVMACSSLGHFSHGKIPGVGYSSGGSMHGGSMWKPSNKEQAKESCDRIFVRFLNLERKLSELDREQE
jgi:hypothetical protein